MKRTINDLAEITAQKLESDNVSLIAKTLWFELQKQKKFSHLDEALLKIRRIRASKENKIIVEIQSHKELTDAEKKDAETKIEQKLQSKILPRYSVHSQLLGGLKIKIDDEILDLSWRGKLEKIKEKTGR